MKVNYSPYLRVNDNSTIRRWLADPNQTETGYLQFRDGNRSFVPPLPAPSNEVVAIHRTLIGAWLRDIAHVYTPRLSERDGERFLEASEYFGSFSQHMAETKLDIPYPREHPNGH